MVVWLAGEEEFLKEERLRELKTNILGATLSYPDYNMYYAGEADIRAVVDTCRLMPFSAKKRLVALKAIENLKQEDAAILARFIKHPADTACLVIMSSGKSIDKDLQSALTEYAKIEHFSPLKGEKLYNWVKTRFKSAGKSISHSCVGILIELLGGNLYNLSSAIEKLALFVGRKTYVEQHHIEQLIGREREMSGFEYIDAINSKDYPEALKVISGLLTEGTTAQELLGLIGWQIGQFRKVAGLLEEGHSNSSISRILNIPTFKIDNIINLVKHSKPVDLEAKLGILLDCDLSIKTGRQRPQEALELLTLKLCN